MVRFIFTVLVMISGAAHARDLQFRTSEFLKAEVSKTLNLLSDNFLPVNAKVLFVESRIQGDELLKDDLCHIDGKVQFGFTKRNTITISSRLVELAQKSSKKFDCSHGSFQKMLIAVIAHELTHIKDNAEKISVNADFQRIVGVKKVQRSSKKKLFNQNISSSPDAYEFKNLEEALAVNTEYFLLDEEFECRKPATAEFLSKALNIPLKKNCEKNYDVTVQSAYVEDNYLLSKSIDPKRIYQVHYLFAGKGEQIMSRWGHAMFRLVVCAPQRKIVGPDCLKDVSHHLALSYRAYMTDINVSYMKGMFGKYPSQLFIMRFLEVQQEYTKFELRDLYSIPLKMNTSEKNDFIDLTLERFWTYQGKYYFLNNNCGTEAQKHLVSSLEGNPIVGSVTPLKMYKDILSLEKNLSEDRVSGLKRHELIQEGILIESVHKELNETFLFLKKASLFKEKNLKDFLKHTKAGKRLARYETLNWTNLAGSLRKSVVMKLVYMERYLLSKFVRELPVKIVKEMNKDKVLKSEILKMGENLKLLTVQPWEIIQSSYGVPSVPEFNEKYSTFVESRKDSIAASAESQLQNLQQTLRKNVFGQELNELENLKSIKKITNDLISSLEKK